ncbi:RNA ligase [Staphylococcus phage vB_SscM-1]|uniref:DNA ligase n=2 Tax=Sciuriunavirus SscM1 TaxID=2734053 RepID=A0A1X9I9N0_9CAUD|nr:RNA ligase [Staphylococcus phage vB_SscM-1]ANT44726.1 DNA ligase [Staphylococcus phage vB_SscM-1]ANT44928.1 DNA ligase [Staphylococcus phage vB_SscM-2]
MKHYDKIKNKGVMLESFKERGLVVQEKLDGSNASFTMEDLELVCFSRRKKLNEHETLRGFYNWVHENINVNNTYVSALQRYIIFGEWLVKNRINYKDEYYYNFYVFDIYDKEYDIYLPYEEVKVISHHLGLQMVKPLMVLKPSMYLNELDMQEIKDLVGKSDMTVKPNTGEGVVIKYLNGKTEYDDYYKIVSKEFKEFSKKKMKAETRNNDSVADYAITKARMEKMIFRAIEENRLSEDDLELENFSLIMKQVGNDFVNDIMEEEKENILKIVEKQIKKKMPHTLREVIEEKGEIVHD